MNRVKCALTIAGTDPSGGAGIQADLKTFQELQSYGMSVVTSVVAQNTTGVSAVHHLPVTMLKQQLYAVSDDMPIDALKTGMVATIDMMEVLKQWLKETEAAYVMDPVMVATSGDPLIEEKARDYLRKELVPLTTLVTPNIPEAEYLTGKAIETEEAMKKAAEELVEVYGAGAALVKGGHLRGHAVDYLYDGNEMTVLEAERIDTNNTHGTGCTYSAAITAYLSRGDTLKEAVRKSKYFVTEAIRYSFDLGAGSGPTNHFATRKETMKG
ncbi:bifunctional hydroxymethylpyrimidine kinase/phosphomethylpyrimidine kinase [Halobacillus sp. ACCC02827]|uniref:bifunctional hydroxymethylpyrimidine kinase/phosphomethylpyrimidine kinase n=1 Tax=unclassified Halobacillus TaxID=2636472 RepID=UPI0002A4DA63|nr:MULTISPECIES: bifunctional hydroxymethylpyrimidine kinase/phosphomethylpyrimidine kinase [unclassified Halobacillus]ELK46332.1 phosphomethylpyrimidine kinase [Halobacillus sp. BAB-2008]WJE15599.1 bifunctional hydroxymethylpyrimidine kinase/phosphomethylpyrimidine kinase [Halobacillus sp. ACCC02827]